MNALEAALRRVLSDLDEIGARWALVGGLAVSARAEPRTTRDVDLAVATDGDESAEKVVFALQSVGYSVHMALEHDVASRLATVRLTPPAVDTEQVLVDLMFASSGIEPEIVRDAQPLEILPGLTTPVATTGHLIALKVLARDDRARPQDWDDIHALLREAEDHEIQRAHEALVLIAKRGYSRGKDLAADFEGMRSGRG